MPQLVLEQVTRYAVVFFYATALVFAIRAIVTSRMWARTVSAVAITVVAAVWLFFYVVLVSNPTHPHTASTLVLWSRTMHYVTAAALSVTADLISRSERYSVQAVVKMKDDE